jgi:hypothetical protein
LNLKSSLRQPPEQLLICHAGPVIDMAASPVDEHLATLGKDGRLFIYNYVKKKLLLVKRFQAEGSCLLWLPLDVSYAYYVCRIHKKGTQDRELLNSI